MTAIDQISHIERKIYAAKGMLKALKQKRWVNENYKEKPADSEAIQQAEQELETHRKTLAKLIINHYQIKV